MKPKILKLPTMFLFLFPICVVLLAGGCKKDNYENISLEYIKCPCASEMNFIEKISINEILLFDTTKTTFAKMQELSLEGNTSHFVCYNPESNNAVFYSYKGASENINFICNFPMIAGKWQIPFSGIYISYSADVFESCDPNGSIEFFYSEAEIVLTSLKKYDK